VAGFVHLHCRSAFSLKDGAYLPEALAERAAALGMPGVAMTDADTLLGAVRFVDACARVGVKPILGARLTLAATGPSLVSTTISWGSRAASAESRTGPAGAGPSTLERRRREGSTSDNVVVLARDAVGYANLCRLLTKAHMGGERGEPSLRPSEVMARAGGLVCLLGPGSPPGRMALSGRPGAARELLRPWREAFGPWCFVEVRHLLEPGSITEVRALLRLAEEAEVPAVATNAVRYLVPEDAFVADALECMREIVPIADRHVSRRNAEGWLKPAAAMRALFAERPDVCDATVRIAEACEFDLGLGRVHFPDFPTPAGRSATSLLAERCHRGLDDREIGRGREVLDRLDRELGDIRRMGYSAYFLTVADIVREVKAMGVRCAARGSAAGSLVCYLTGISEVDPVHHGLLFERFINPLRDELPDIDLDVESARREEVYDMVLRRYGDDRCACVTMVDTYRARAAVREVGKALGYPDDEIDRVAKAFPHVGAHRIRDALETLPELRGSNLGAGQLETLFRVAERLNGFPRHLALHPSGIVLSGDDLPDRVPMERSFLGHRMVQADKDDVERLGLLKLDVLGVRMLSAMRHALDEIERTTGEAVDLERIPRDDEATFQLIRESGTLGCFQIESPGQRELLQKFQPTRFEDLIIDISLFRPGPVKSDMVTPFLNRRHRWERPRYAHPMLKPILRETHGVIVYHEQVMRVLAASGCSLAEADRIRRHLDDIEVDDLRRDFLFGATAAGLGSGDAETVWRELSSFASFGFCKAHAAAFAVPTYQSAWLKANHTAAFLAGVLTHEPGMYPRRLILEDAREQGVPILPLDANHSQKAYTVEPVIPLVGAVDQLVEPSRRLRSNVLGPAPAVPVRDSADAARLPQEVASSIERPAMAGGGRGGRRRGAADMEAKSGSPAACDSPAVVPNGVRAARAAPPAPTQAFGIRVGLQDVHGISGEEIGSILAARAERPFTTVLDFMRRTGVSRPVMEAMAHAGAFDALEGRAATAPRSRGAVPRSEAGPPQRVVALRGAERQQAPRVKPWSRRDRLFVAMTADPQREGEQLALAVDGDDGPPGLREYTDAERVRAELEVTGMDVSRHLLSFYEPVLSAIGVVRSGELRRHRGDEWVMVAGVKVSSQTPAVRSGQRIIFLTLDDATGPIEVTVFERVQDRCARTVFHGFLLAIWGRLRRTGVGGVSIAAEEVWDLVALNRALREGRLARAMADGVGSAERSPRKLWHASGGSAGW
jgi:error-prone DNA polymerase